MSTEKYETGDMLSAFPIEELTRMVKNIDRFDTDVPSPAKEQAEAAIKKSEEVSEQIINEDA